MRPVRPDVTRRRGWARVSPLARRAALLLRNPDVRADAVPSRDSARRQANVDGSEPQANRTCDTGLMSEVATSGDVCTVLP